MICKNKCIIESNKQPARLIKYILYPKDPYEAKYQFLINKRERTGLNFLWMILKLLLSVQMICEDVYKNIDEYNAD